LQLVCDSVEYVTPGGLIVQDKRARAFPRDVDPNGNPAVGTVGPDVSAGYGDTHVMYADSVNGWSVPPPPMVQAWAGWPVEWATPMWGSMVGLSEITKRVSTVFAAIDKQARILSTMPPYRTRGGKIAPTLAWMRNPQPEVYTDWIEAFRQIVYSYLGAGEVILWATSRFNESRRVASFVMLNPGWVNIDLDGNIRTYRLGEQDITSDVLHIRYASWPGDAHGHGPLEAAARSMFGAAALEQYQADLASRGGIPWGVITTPGRLTAEQASDMRWQYVSARSGARAAPAVFSGGATLNALNISPKDMALLELRQFDEARIAVLLGVPPFLLALPTGADSLTYSTTESMYDFHWRSSLRPLAAELTSAIGRWALSNPEEALELNRDEYTRPSFADRVSAYATLHAIVEIDAATGVERRGMSIDEIRAAERLDVDDAAPARSTSLAVVA
jgi:HK97 family phage portal protein